MGRRIRDRMPPLSESGIDPVYRGIEFWNDVPGRYTVTFIRQSPAEEAGGSVEYEGDYPWAVPGAPLN